MSTQRQVTVRDLVEEAKKRMVVIAICIVGLSYLMSLTSSSVWVNLPAAASLIILLRYFTLDYEMQRKLVSNGSKPASASVLSQNAFPVSDCNIIERSDWRTKINSTVVEDAVDHFTRHLVSEWVTDLWYTKLTPDRQGPEELVQIMNGVIGELSNRLRNMNLIDFLTRDLIGLICTHLELFRASQAKMNKKLSDLSSIEERDKELRNVLAAENKLHPALFSAEAEHKVLQHVMDGLISLTFKPEDLQCSFFRYISRELLASVVMRPVLNLASPRFINERIEIFAISKASKGAVTAQDSSHPKTNGSSGISSEHFFKFLDPTVNGVELVQLKNEQPISERATFETDNVNGNLSSKDPLLSINTRSSHSWNSLPLNSQISRQGEIQRHRSGGEWGDMLDIISHRKTAALAPENFENMWTKGRNYRKQDGDKGVIEQVPKNSSGCKSLAADHSKKPFKETEKRTTGKLDTHVDQSIASVNTSKSSNMEKQLQFTDQNMSNHSIRSPHLDDDDHGPQHVDDTESGSGSAYTSEEDDDNSIVTGLDSPGTMVWDGKANRNVAVSQIHHPLENPAGHTRKKTGRRISDYQQLHGLQAGRERLRSSSRNVHVWQEVERTSFLSGDGWDVLSSKADAKADDSSGDYEVESLSRVHSGAAASSSSFLHSLTADSSKNLLTVESFYKLRCEVLGANIVKSGSETFAVYSLSVNDVNNNRWSIKRRFRHFEELHRRLKEYPEYNLHLPPKNFLSTGLDVYLIQERCTLLDRYLKKLLQLPTISGSIEVWDFLSVDSQTYWFSNSFSIIETLSVNLDDNPFERRKKGSNSLGPFGDCVPDMREQSGAEKSAPHMKHSFISDVRTGPKTISNSPGKKFRGEFRNSFEDSASDSDSQKNASSVIHIGRTGKGRERNCFESESPPDSFTDSTLPEEWVPPNLTLPILDLVDVILQLQDGGWIRRKAFWVVKQILQLGMGDALDDWLLEKIQLLHKGSVVASGIKRVEQILWPDGMFITKHPNRRPPSTINSTPSSPHGQQPTSMSSPRLTDEQQREADQRAKFVYELIIDKAPAAIVGLVGRKEYEQCAKDLYFFIQSSVFLKLLAFNLLELFLLSAFPEMDFIFQQLHKEKHRFGEFMPS